MITSQDVLENLTASKKLSEDEYHRLVKDFQISFWTDQNFYENLSNHRRPQEYKQEVLQILYDLVRHIQLRPELRDIDNIKNVQGFSHVRVQEIWAGDKRLRSIYNATRKYCDIRGKDFTTTIVHIAEYRALNLLIKKIRRSINRGERKIINHPHPVFA